MPCGHPTRQKQFQSTPPVKAATDAAGVLSDAFDISIHAAREGGDRIPGRKNRLIGISIHAAREGGDAPSFVLIANYVISIHAAREGGDPS